MVPLIHPYRFALLLLVCFHTLRNALRSTYHKIRDSNMRLLGGGAEGDASTGLLPVPRSKSLHRWRSAVHVLKALRRCRYNRDRRNASLWTKFRVSFHVLWAIRRSRSSSATESSERLLPEADIAEPQITHQIVRDHEHREDEADIDEPQISHLVRDHEHRDDGLKKLGGVNGVMALLRTSAVQGVADEPQEELESRRKKYGSNIYETPISRKRFWRFFVEACRSINVMILLVCAAATTAADVMRQNGWYDGASIVIGVIFVAIVKSVSDYRQRGVRFLSLNGYLNEFEAEVEVIRNGRRAKTPIVDIVVGDIVVLKGGDEVPADGLFVDGQSLHVDEFSLNGDSRLVRIHNEFPYLQSGSKVRDGNATMVVTAVGMDTGWGQSMMGHMNEDGEDVLNGITPLQARLDEGHGTLTSRLGVSGILLLVTMLISYFALPGVAGERTSRNPRDIVFDVVDIMVAVVTIAVDLPEGLSLCATLTLTDIMNKMIKGKKALLRRPAACETVASLTTLCCDETWLLTSNKKKKPMVDKVWTAGRLLRGGGLAAVPDAEALCCKQCYDTLFEAIHYAQNTTTGSSVSIPMTRSRQHSTEMAAVLEWGWKMGFQPSVSTSCCVLQVEPFDPEKRKSGVALKVAGSGSLDAVHVHWNGDAETILSQSSSFLCSDSASSSNSSNSTTTTTTTTTTMPIDEERRRQLEKVIESMAAERLQCFAFGYMRLEDLSNIPEDDAMRIVNERKIPEGPLTLIAIMGIKVECRQDVADAVDKCRKGGISVKMITGDSIERAKAIATECGILREGDMAIDGETLRNYDDEELKQILDKVTVVARASPSDKQFMVRALRKQLGQVVGVMSSGGGDTISSDAPALREANVGLIMRGTRGSAAAAAKEGSSNIVMIMGDGSFASVLDVVGWGRSLYLNAQKFIQFQCPAKLVSFVIVHVVTLSAMELLWLKLIWTTIGALAIAATGTTTDHQTSTPPPTVAPAEHPTPIQENHPLVTNIMCRNMLSQAMYQIFTLLLLLLYLGGKDLDGTEFIIHRKTLIFNALVFCQIFNMLNARNLQEKNVLKGILSDRLFLGIVANTVVLQVAMLHLTFLNRFASTVKLGWVCWTITILIASMSCPLASLTMFIPVTENPNFASVLIAYDDQLHAFLAKFVGFILACLVRIFSWTSRVLSSSSLS